MTGPLDPREPDLGSDLDPVDLARSDELVDALAADAVSWDVDGDAAVGLLAALRADVDLDVDSAVVAETATVVPLSAGRSRRIHNAKRVGVAGALAVAVLSASGMAAAGTLSAHPGDPGHAIFTLFHGKSVSEKAADKADRALDLAAVSLDSGRLHLVAVKLGQAQQWIALVKPADLGNLDTRLVFLQGQYGLALAAADAEPGDDNGGHGQEPGDDNGGHGAEPGDDNGGSHGGEPGDDSGGGQGDDTGGGHHHGGQPGDDNGQGGSGGSDDSGTQSGGGSGGGGSDDSGTQSGGGSGGGGSDDSGTQSGGGSGSGGSDDSGGSTGGGSSDAGTEDGGGGQGSDS